MSSHHLIARGVELASVHFKDGGEVPTFEMPAWGILVLVITFLSFAAVSFAVSYSYGAVVAALTIVESPHTDVYVAVNDLDHNSPKNPNDPLLEPELLAVKPQPITAKIRTTIRHLRARAGYWSRFRGLSLYLCYSVVRSLVISGFTSSSATHNLVGRFVACFVAEVMLARWLLTWVHIVISEPSEKKWWKRIPTFKSGAWKKIAPSAALVSVAGQLCVIFPALLAKTGPIARFSNPSFQPTGKDVMHAMCQSLGLLLLTFALIVLIDIPAQVTLIRVAASMLPEEDESIVPFDRTFGGKVTPEIVGGAGKVGMLEAWRSFAWSSRVRLLKLVAKVLTIQFVLAIGFMMVYVGELRLIMGKDMDEMVKTIANKLQGN